VARLRARVERAVALHRQAAALAAAAAPVLDAYAPAGAPTDQYAEQHDLAASLRSDVASLAPGWLAAPLDALAPMTSLGGPLSPTFVRVGQAHPLDDARFPVVVPLLGAGHIAIDADARDDRVAGLLRSLVLRLLASSPPGSVQVRTVDATEAGATFTGFTGIDAMPPPATDIDGLRKVLDEGERWIGGRAGDGAGPTLLIVIASLPELTEGSDLARIAALAHAGPAGRLHLIAAGWPPPPLTAETTQAPLPHATQIALRNPHAWVGDPPGATFGASGLGPSRLNAPVYLDPDPPAKLVRGVCAQLTAPWATPPGTLAGEPSRTAWLDYLAAAQRLDAVRRDAAAVVAEHKAALKAAREDLALVLAKLARHQARLSDVAHLTGARPVELTPGWPDAQAAQATLAGRLDPGRHRATHTTSTVAARPPITALPVPAQTQFAQQAGAPPSGWGTTNVSAPPRTQAEPRGAPPNNASAGSGVSAARPARAVSGPPTSPLSPAGIHPTSPAPGSVPARVSAVLRTTVATLDASDAGLAESDAAAAPARLRLNVVTYGAFAILAALVQLPLLFLMNGGSRVGVLAVPCAIVLPVLSFGLAWLTIGALPPKDAPRTPLLGGVISLLALVPLVVLLAKLAMTGP
jgi:hypothetical protein